MLKEPVDRRCGLDWLTARPIAHRGLHDLSAGIVENTVSAFAAALDRGYAIECDLQLSGDGEAMVFHDPWLERLMRANGMVNRFLASELVDMPFRTGGDRMQRLAELFEQVDGEVPLVLELKSHWDGDLALARRVCKLASGYAGPVAIMSFDPVQMAVFRDEAPALPRGLVADLFEAEDWPMLDEEQRHFLAGYRPIERIEPDFMSIGLKALGSDKANRFRSTGRPTICWTVKSPEIAEQCLSLCDQITFEGFFA